MRGAMARTLPCSDPGHCLNGSCHGASSTRTDARRIDSDPWPACSSHRARQIPTFWVDAPTTLDRPAPPPWHLPAPGLLHAARRATADATRLEPASSLLTCATWVPISGRGRGPTLPRISPTRAFQALVGGPGTMRPHGACIEHVCPGTQLHRRTDSYRDVPHPFPACTHSGRVTDRCVPGRTGAPA